MSECDDKGFGWGDLIFIGRRRQRQRERRLKMCQKDSGRVLIARKPKGVWKVVRNWEDVGHIRSLFQSHQMIKAGEIVITYTLPKSKRLTAVGFNEGFGFGCFGQREQAEQYLQIIHHIFYAPALMIKATIPTGSRYVHGKIDPDSWGAGLKTIRTSHLYIPQQ